jgi:O-antigen/teichoic acid export membrane protein
MNYAWRLSPRLLFEQTASCNVNQIAARGGFMVIGGQGIQFAVVMLRTAILARLLDPADFGVIAMVSVVLNFAMIFKDAGFSIATIQRPKITHEQISNMFWLNLLASVGVGGAVLAASPFVAWFYSVPELTRITAALSLSVVLNGMVMQHQALLQRHMKFGILTGLQSFSHVVSLFVSIVLACRGWQYWSLVVGTLAYSITSVSLIFLACPWIPGRMTRRAGVREIVSFGGYLSIFNLVNYFARNADNLLIGKFSGASSLGLYNRAYQILLLPISLISGPLSGVAIPALSKLSQDTPRMLRHYLQLLYLLSMTGGIIAGMAYLAREEIVLLLLGKQWMEVASIFRFLALGAMLQPIYNTQSWLHLAMGRADRVMRWGMVGTPLIVAAFAIGIAWGLQGVAVSFSLVMLPVTFGSVYYGVRSAGGTLSELLKATGMPIAASLISVGLVVAALPFLPAYSLIAVFLIKIVLFLTAFGMTIIVLEGDRRAHRRVLKILKMVFAKS